MNKWKTLVFTHGIKEIVNLFNSTFLGIYFFKITEGSTFIVALYYLVYYLSHILWRYLVSVFMNSKNVIKTYRTGIFSNLIMSLILILAKENIVNYIFLFATIYAFSQCLYWTSYEIIINDLNKKNSFNKYFTYDSVLNSISNLIFPLIFGIIIEKYTYPIVFVILCLIALVSFILSLNIKSIDVECEKINLRDFFKNIKKKDTLKLIGLQSVSDGLTNGGVAQLLATLVIFSKISSESFIGYISSALGVVCIIVAIVAEKKLNYKNYKKIVLPISVISVLITIPLSINTSIIIIVIYKVIFEICNVLINIEGNAIMFNSLKQVCDEKYKVSYLWYQELALNIGRGIGLISIIMVNELTKNINSLSVLFVLFSSFFIVRTIVITKLQSILLKST